MSSNIFNVAEVTGKELSALETTAAEARIGAPNSHVAAQIDKNAEKEQKVAQQAALAAQSLGSKFTGDTPTAHAQHETTAAEARNQAPDTITAHEVEANARREQQAAAQVAVTAKTLGSRYTGEPATAATQFEGEAARTTNAAVAEGRHDVEQAKAVGAGYVEQAKQLASSAFETAQSYLPSGIVGGTSSSGLASPGSTTAKSTTESGAGVLASLQGTAQNAYQTAQPHIQNAYQTAHPHVENAYTTIKEATQPHVEKATGVAQEYLGSARATVLGSSTTDAKLQSASAHNIPATSAPLETGSHTVKSPYDGVSTEKANPSVVN